MPSNATSSNASVTETASDARAAAVASNATGWVHLDPIEGSVDRSTITVELTLQRDDGVLVLGDLRLAAVQAEVDGRHEAAHRLWSVVVEAARRLGDDELVTAATAKADGVRLQLHGANGNATEGPHEERRADDTGERRRASDFGPKDVAGDEVEAAKPPVERRRGVSYDYQLLSDDRAAGMTQSAVAERWGCSVGTVARAEQYVRARDAVEDMSDLERLIHCGTAVDELAERFDLSTKVMRWIVSDYWERRG